MEGLSLGIEMKLFTRTKISAVRKWEPVNQPTKRVYILQVLLRSCIVPVISQIVIKSGSQLEQGPTIKSLVRSWDRPVGL